MTHSKNERKTISVVFTIIPMLLLVTSIACSSLDSDLSSSGSTFSHQSDVATASFASSSAQSDKFASTSFSSPSSNTVSYTINDFDDDDRIKISFHEDNIYWKAYFEEDELVELYKDDEKVSKSDFSKYEDLIYKRYEEFTENMADFDIQMDELKIDLEQLKVDLSGLKDIKIDFDSEEFALEMKEMKRELKNGLAELKELDFNFDIDIDFEELNENLKNIKIDLSGFDEDMASLKIELSELKEELIILESFVKELKDELVDDGYLDKSEDDFDLVLTKSKMIVNDERLPERAHQKYLELYEDHFGRELDDDFRISN